MKKYIHCFLVVIGVVASSFAANTWYANAANAGKSTVTVGGEEVAVDGTSQERGWGTLQEAHDNAVAGDTIKIVPGDYNQGGAAYSQTKSGVTKCLMNRLMVTKKLTFEAIGRAAETRIVGQHGTDCGNGFGYDGVRCVFCSSTAEGTIFRKITFANGGTANDNNYEDGLKSGGGFFTDGSCSKNFAATETAYKYYLDQCVFTNCTALFGGAQFGGTAIRCHFVDNIGSAFGQAICEGAAWNCLIEHTYADRTDRPIFGNYTRAVNCTVYDAYTARGATHGVKLYNTVIAGVAIPFGGYEDTKYNYVEEFYKCYSNVNDTDAAGWDAYILASPGSGDYRLSKGTCAEGGGETKYLKPYTEGGEGIILLPDWVEMKDFAGNAIDLTKDAVDAGCFQGAVEPKTGIVTVSEKSEVDGHLNINATYVRTSEWPKQFRIVPRVSGKGEFFRYYYKGTSDTGMTYRYLEPNGGLHVVPPADTSVVRVLQEEFATKELWTKPNADADVADGTEENPYHTLQAAMDAIRGYTETAPKVIVHALPGKYNEGFGYLNDHSNRVVVAGNACVLLKSTAGAAKTIICGKVDAKPPLDDPYRGCGPAAMRCVAVETLSSGCSCAIQGFTFADGCSDMVNYKEDKICDRGGGFYGDDSAKESSQVLDCVFTNCCAVRMGAMYAGYMIRCVMDDCVSFGGVTRYTKVISSDVRGTCKTGTNPGGAAANYVVGSHSWLLFSTFAPFGDTYVTLFDQREGFSKDCTGNITNGIYGCVFGPNTYRKTARYYGTVWQTNNIYWSASDFEGGADAELGLVDAEKADLRLYSYTQALKAAQLPERGTDAWEAYEYALVNYCGCGIDGAALVVENGKSLPGAYQKLVTGAFFLDDSKCGNAVALSGTKAGCNKIADLEAAIAITPVDKNVCAVVIEGATNEFINGACEAVAASQLDGYYVTPEVLYTPEWFVDHENGDDASYDGFTSERPKKTLKGALQYANRVGQIVHVAAGTYDTDAMYDAGEGACVASRAVVRRGVILEGAGADTTFIVGAEATGEYRNTSNVVGCGTNAVRCVAMESGAVVRGFTLKDGFTWQTESSQFDTVCVQTDFTGGGVRGLIATGRNNAPGYNDKDEVLNTRVENCFITNCTAMCGGGGYGVTFYNCRIVNCYAHRGAAVERCGMWGTLTHDNSTTVANSGLCVNNTYICTHCVLGPGRSSYGARGGAAYWVQWSAGDLGLINTIVLGTTHGVTDAKYCRFTATECTSEGMLTSRVMTQAAMKLNSDYSLQEDSPLIDAGVAENAGLDKDIFGTQRVYNGAPDIGMAEFDWLPRYAAALGDARLEVTAASPMVVKVDAGVKIPEGATLAASWKNPFGKTMRSTITAEVPVEGVLTVALNGVLDDTLAAGTQTYTIANKLAENKLLFTATAGDSTLVNANHTCGMAIFIR